MVVTIVNSKHEVVGQIQAQVGMVDHTKTWRVIGVHQAHLDVESYDGNWQDAKHTFMISEKEARKWGKS